MDRKTRVWNAINLQPVDRVPFDLFDEAGYLFDGGRYDPAQRLRLSMREQIAARIRFHQEFDTDLIFDTPVLGASQVDFTVRLAPEYAERYELHFATFPITAGLWHPWPPHLEPNPNADTSKDDRVELLVEWDNGLSCALTIEAASGTASGYEVLMQTREQWPLWKDVCTPNLAAFDYSYVDQILAATGGDVALYGTIASPYGTFSILFGVEQGTYLFYDDPEFASEVMAWLTDVAIEVGRDLIRHGVDVLRVGEATSSLLSPRFYQRHVLPHHRRMNNALRSAGGATITHACGHSSALLESFAESAASGIEPLTPPPLGNTLLTDAKRRVGDRVCLKGGLDPVHVVASLSAAEVATETLRCLEEGSRGGGYILSVADCMAPGTPIENMTAIAEVVHGFSPD
jgi:uroporphyrinogen-III decarboxylase